MYVVIFEKKCFVKILKKRVKIMLLLRVKNSFDFVIKMLGLEFFFFYLVLNV